MSYLSKLPAVSAKLAGCWIEPITVVSIIIASVQGSACSILISCIFHLDLPSSLQALLQGVAEGKVLHDHPQQSDA